MSKVYTNEQVSNKFKILGLMLTRDDTILLNDWLDKYYSIFDKISGFRWFDYRFG